MFNRERLEVKQKLLALGKEVSLTAGDGSPLAVEASVEHPALWNHKQVEAQHVFFSRNEGARKELDRIIDRARPMSAMLEDPTPLRNHLFLSVTIDHTGVEYAVKLHPDARVDRQNLERKLGEHWEREKLIGLVRELGEGWRIGVTGWKSADAAGGSTTAKSSPRSSTTSRSPSCPARPTSSSSAKPVGCRARRTRIAAGPRPSSTRPRREASPRSLPILPVHRLVAGQRLRVDARRTSAQARRSRRSGRRASRKNDKVRHRPRHVRRAQAAWCRRSTPRARSRCSSGKLAAEREGGRGRKG